MKGSERSGKRQHQIDPDWTESRESLALFVRQSWLKKEFTVDTITSGTIVIGTTRDDFAILATDRMWSTHGNKEPFRRGFHRKIFLHPRLPIAIATTGLVHVYKHTKVSRHPIVNVRVYIRCILKKITKIGPDTLSYVKSEYERLILHGIIETGEKSSQIGTQIEKCNLLMIVAIFSEITPRIHIIGVGSNDKVATEEHHAFIQNHPSINDLYNKRIRSTYVYFLGGSYRDPDRLSLHIRDSIAKGIAVEAEAHDGENRECGGTVDVALIDARGARFSYLDSKKL